MTATLGRVLIAAGSDSGGGAGIQADIKAVTALGGFAMTAVTALTAQNTEGVFGVVGIEPAFIAQQMELVLRDIGADCLKTGMLHNAAVIEAVAGVHGEMAAAVPLVVDPVMVAKGGHALLESEAVQALRARLLPQATLVTPNLPEAEALTGLAVTEPEAMVAAGEAIRAMGPAAVLIKGGHLAGERLYDVLVAANGVEVFEDARIATRHTHGTGCTLASAIATGIAQGMGLRDAVARARAYVREAIRTAPGLGHGHGPLNHGHTVRPFGGG
ncbi:MAG: bifunctional hydroxymethylpyrimidine kinase/phosphomethylpyrimidine kinase [Alphaproteobacteria bacterium]